MKSSLALFGLSAILITIVFSYLVLINAPDQIWSWWIGLTSTIVSILLGIFIAISIFFFQNSITKKENKEKYLFLLDEELAASWQSLQAVDNPIKIKIEEKTFCFQALFLQHLILEDTAKTGYFDKNETRILLKLNRWISYHNIILNYLFNYLPNLNNDSLSKQRLDLIWKAHKPIRETIVQDIQGIAARFQLKILQERIEQFPLKNL